MRKLFCFTIGFSLSCIGGAFLLQKQWAIYLIPVLLTTAGCACAVEWFVHTLKVKAFKLLILGCAAGFCWLFIFNNFYVNNIAYYGGTEQYLTFTAIDYSEKTDYGRSTTAWIILNGYPYKATVYLSEEYDIQPGDSLSGTFAVRTTASAGSNPSDYNQGSGIFLTLTEKKVSVDKGMRNIAILYLPAKIRKFAQEILEQYFDSDTEGFARALLLGDVSDLSYEDDTALKISGIRHVAAVSGLHVSTIFGVLIFLLGMGRKRTVIISLPVLFMIAAVAGFTPSVTRACLMCGVLAVSRCVSEEYDGLSSLAFACLVMLIINPYCWKSVSFQLSVASVLGILVFAPKISQWCLGNFTAHGKKPGRLLLIAVSSFSISLGAAAVTTPLSAYYFGMVSVVSILTNLLTVWIVSILFCGIICVVIIGGVWLNGAKLLSIVLSLGIRYVLFCASFLSGFPFSAVYTESIFTVIWLIAVYILLIVLLLPKKRHPALFCVSVVWLLVFAMVLSIIVPALDTFRLTVADVGEGQCVILQYAGKAIMIDCGGDDGEKAADTAAQILLSQGITALEALILTHYDEDHCGGVKYLLTRISTANIFLPQISDNNFLSQLSTWYNGSKEIINKNTKLNLGDAQLTLLYTNQQQNSVNENCMCVLFESDECDILITGDRGTAGEKALINENNLPHVDILIAGHHGAKTSTTQVLLDVLQPDIVIISAGTNNRYGHPSQEVLDRLYTMGCTIYRTDESGTIIVRR